MRLNRYISMYTDLSRRKADASIEQGSVIVNRKTAHMGMQVTDQDVIIVDGKRLIPVEKRSMTVMLNKPIGYVCSKDGQGSPTVYDLLQKGMQHLNIAGRLDKDSSGLVILTDDGQLLQELTHPSYNKEKVYLVKLEKKLDLASEQKLANGVNIGDERLSSMKLKRINDTEFQVTLTEGRNRQIRRSFEGVGVKVVKLHRKKLGPYELKNIASEQFKEIEFS